MKNLYLIDGNSLMFRSFYATSYTGNLMKTQSGIYTNALFGFVNMMTKLIDSNDINYCFVAFDAGKQTFRHKEYSEYKGGRKPLPEELRIQIPIIKEYCDIMNIKRMESLDFEADDLLATVSKKFYDDFDKIYVISGDHDLLQLVNEKISVGLTIKGVGEIEYYTLDNFYEKLGFNPNQLIDYKGICGDKSDNLPGVRGMGDKTTVKLLNEYKTLENIYDNLDKLTLKQKELFLTYKDSAYMCKHLATLSKEAIIDFNKDDLFITPVDNSTLYEFYKKYEFHSLTKRLEKNITKEIKKREFEYCNDYSNIKGKSYIVCEVFKKNYIKGEFLGLGIYNNDKYYFIEKNDISKVKDYLENNDEKYTFDFKMLYYVLKSNGIIINNVKFDLLLASYLVNPNYASDDFSEVIKNFSDENVLSYDTIYGMNTKMEIPSLDVIKNYSLTKCCLISEVYNDCIKKLEEFNCTYLYNIELELSKVLVDMEMNGLYIDLDMLNTIGNEYKEKLEVCTKKIFEISKHEFNLNSPKQLGEVLFDELHLPHGKKNKTGYSTSVEILEKLKNFEIVNYILEYRMLSKLISTYVNGLNEIQVNSFVYPMYKQTLTNTGRLSCVEPNIQNIPVRTKLGENLRKVFKSRFKDGLIISCDYSQIELRVLASLSNDKIMLDSFNNDVDFHSKTASLIYDCDINNVTSEMRRCAKAINFGIIYGMSSWGLSDELNITPLEANMFINKYFDTYKEAKVYLDSLIDFTRKNGYSLTMFNRRRYIPEINDKNYNLRQFGERSAMNSPIQGSAADIMKIAMVNVFKKLKEKNYQSLLIAQVHDELILDCPKNEVNEILDLVKYEMTNCVKTSCVLKANGSYGVSWYEAK